MIIDSLGLIPIVGRQPVAQRKPGCSLSTVSQVAAPASPRQLQAEAEARIAAEAAAADRAMAGLRDRTMATRRVVEQQMADTSSRALVGAGPDGEGSYEHCWEPCGLAMAGLLSERRPCRVCCVLLPTCSCCPRCPMPHVRRAVIGDGLGCDPVLPPQRCALTLCPPAPSPSPCRQVDDVFMSEEERKINRRLLEQARATVGQPRQYAVRLY